MAGTLDQKTFEKLFREEFKGLVVFAIRFLKDYETAREIVQESFVNLWNTRERIDMAKPVKTYLATMVRNRSLNYLRDHKKFDTNILIHENLFPVPVYEQPLLMEEHELSTRIQNAVAELPEKCREVFLLSRNENLKYQQIADKLGISVKTVETQMSKALQHLRHRLKEYLTG